MRWYDRRRRIKCLRTPRKGAFTTWREMPWRTRSQYQRRSLWELACQRWRWSHPTLMAADPPLSLASQLPQGYATTLADNVVAGGNARDRAHTPSGASVAALTCLGMSQQEQPQPWRNQANDDGGNGRTDCPAARRDTAPAIDWPPDTPAPAAARNTRATNHQQHRQRQQDPKETEHHSLREQRRQQQGDCRQHSRLQAWCCQPRATSRPKARVGITFNVSCSGMYIR